MKCNKNVTLLFLRVSAEWRLRNWSSSCQAFRAWRRNSCDDDRKEPKSEKKWKKFVKIKITKRTETKKNKNQTYKPFFGLNSLYQKCCLKMPKFYFLNQKWHILICIKQYSILRNCKMLPKTNFRKKQVL